MGGVEYPEGGQMVHRSVQNDSLSYLNDQDDVAQAKNWRWLPNQENAIKAFDLIEDPVKKEKFYFQLLQATFEKGVNISDASEVEKIYKKVIGKKLDLSTLKNTPRISWKLNLTEGCEIKLNGNPMLMMGPLKSDHIFSQIQNTSQPHLVHENEMVIVVDSKNRDLHLAASR